MVFEKIVYIIRETQYVKRISYVLIIENKKRAIT